MKKIWRIRKRLMAGCLVVVLVLSMIFVPTKKAYAIVGFDDAAFILAMMAAAGIGFVGYNAYNGSNLAEDLIDELGDIEDSVKNAYDNAVFTVLQGGGGGGDPDDFDPDNDDPEKKPSTWEKLKEWWKKHPNKALSLGATGSVLNAVSRQFGKNLEDKLKEFDFGDYKVSAYHKSIVAKYIDRYPYFAIGICHSTDPNIDLTSNWVIMSVKPICFFYGNFLYNVSAFASSPCLYVEGDLNPNFYYNSGTTSPYASASGKFNEGQVYIYPSPKYIYKTSSEADAHRYDSYQFPSSLNKDSIFKTDAAKKAQEDEEKKDKPVYDNVVLPTQEQMNEYINKLDAIAQSNAEPAVKQEQQQQALNTFVESITNVYPKPDPDPSPDPLPNPDPSPDPDPNPEPDPDAPATDEEAAPYTADLTTVFPFCIPFDLIRAFKVLSAEGEAPVYKMPLKIDYKSIHVSEAWQIDMSDFASVIQILRVMETLGFIVGLILVTRKLIRG